MTSTVALTELSQLMKQADGSFVKAFELLAAQERAKKLPATRKPTKAERQEAAQAILDTKDIAALKELDTLFGSFISLIVASDDVDVEHLTEENKVQMMEQQLANDRMMEFLVAARLRLRQQVFDAITEEYRRKGMPDPANINGEIPVPEKGKKFLKYGAGYGKPKVDTAALRKALDDETWALVTNTEKVKRQIIPAHTTTTFDLDKYMSLATQRPELLDVLRDSGALELGAERSPSFKVSDL